MIIFGIPISASDLWLLGACGALILVFIRLRFTAELRNRDIFNNAAKKFTETFHQELKEVYSNPVKWPVNINNYLDSRINNLKEATGKFRRHLPRLRRYFFDKAWFRFYCCTGRKVDKDCQVYYHYMPFSGVAIVDGKEISHDNAKTYKDDFKKNVDTLLKFAKPK